MYTNNPYLKNIINNTLNKGIKEGSANMQNSESKKNPLKTSKYEMSLNQTLDSLAMTFFNKNSDAQFAFLLYENIFSKKQCDQVLTVVINQHKFIKINISKIKLYKQPSLFLLKIIIKNIPFVNQNDKKILWDRIILFLKVLCFENQADANINISSNIVYEDIEFDDPIEFIRNEIKDVLRAYSIVDSINIYFDNLDLTSYEFFKNIFAFVQAIFMGITQFKFISELYKVNIILDLQERYPGNNNFDELINFELKTSQNYFLESKKHMIINPTNQNPNLSVNNSKY